jgi:hypothetical protein
VSGTPVRAYRREEAWSQEAPDDRRRLHCGRFGGIVEQAEGVHGLVPTLRESLEFLGAQLFARSDDVFPIFCQIDVPGIVRHVGTRAGPGSSSNDLVGLFLGRPDFGHGQIAHFDLQLGQGLAILFRHLRLKGGQFIIDLFGKLRRQLVNIWGAHEYFRGRFIFNMQLRNRVLFARGLRALRRSSSLSLSILSKSNRAHCLCISARSRTSRFR